MGVGKGGGGLGGMQLAIFPGNPAMAFLKWLSYARDNDVGGKNLKGPQCRM